MIFFLVTYDIPDDRRRTKAADVLADYGERVQFSVFELWLDARLEREVQNRLMAIIVPSEDSVRMYPLCANCRTKVQVLGLGTVPRPPGAFIV